MMHSSGQDQIEHESKHSALEETKHCIMYNASRYVTYELNRGD